MSDSKYTKFVRHKMSDNQTYGYMAYCPQDDNVLSIRTYLGSNAHPEIVSGPYSLYEVFEKDLEEITEEQYWIAYKAVVVSLFRIHQEQTALAATF